jgi:hypothetical protein
MTTMFRRLLYTVAVLALLSDFGNARPAEYNTVGRDMYGNTVEQNEAVRLRGAREKTLFAQAKTSREETENSARLYSLIPGVALLAVVALIGVVLCQKK